MADYSSSVPKPQKCMIQNLDTGGEPIVAYFNPKELSIDKKVPWNKHKSTKSDTPLLEFTDADSKELQFELFFDGYEEQVDVHKKYISALEELTKIGDKKRPPMCLFIWANFPKFMGVIESLSTKYTMFLADGTPVRATCTVKMKQAEKLAAAKDEKPKDAPKTGKVEQYDESGTIVPQGDERRADKVSPNNHRGALKRSGSETGQLQPGQQAYGDKA